VSGVSVGRPIVIIEAPSNLGLTPLGVQRLAETLLENGLGKRLGVKQQLRVGPPLFTGARDPETTVLHAGELVTYAARLAHTVGEVIDRGAFPLILGGDCSILLGPALALRRRGRFGLLHIDGHADFFQPEAEPNGEAASMDLALVTGFGPRKLTDLEERAPLVRPEDAVTFGYRDHDDQRTSGSQPVAPELLALDLPRVRELGFGPAAEQTIAHLTREELEGFFIHFDADVLDDAIMPAVEYRISDGLSKSEAVALLRQALGTGRAVGLEVTIYNPALDPGGEAGRLLTELLVEALAG
jgi:arginase